MKLTKVYARFYKSFNFDALRKAHENYDPTPWDKFRGDNFPYVQVPIENGITTIVGANESGKSQLLSAIKKAITGDGIEQRDLCRYCPFFSVARNEECWPHLGIQWGEISDEEAAALRGQLTEAPEAFDTLLMFRESPKSLAVYIPKETGGPFMQHLEGKAALRFGQEIFPKPFEIEADVALPNSVPLSWLIQKDSVDRVQYSRRERYNIMRSFGEVRRHWSDDTDTFSKSMPKIHKALAPFLGNASRHDGEATSEASLDLARDLLIRLAEIDPTKLNDLAEAIRDEHEGHANALVNSINEQLSKRLNFKKWWVQDRDFSLRLTLREMDLVFTIQDRTGTDYTFSERSVGLKYFLSYLVQSQSRDRRKDKPEILLMDEPDAYLSAEAQQDLLKIFSDFAYPNADVAPIQVIFVTHSPFLIDKNHAERIRVLEKGKGLDGTRVIRNASQNHYEPLRSAFGAFVGETAFIGACNLLVEGPADQILLSGIARLLRQKSEAVPERETLDLNRLVIVPCGSASQVPYMLYLIRGRDADKPPVITLLDSDGEGDQAARLMRKDHKGMRRLIDKSYIMQIGELGLRDDGEPMPRELEDLLPPALALAAANVFFKEISAFRETAIGPINPDEFEKLLAQGTSIFKSLDGAARLLGAHIDKIGFARAVLDVCHEPGGDEAMIGAAQTFVERMRRLFAVLNERARGAERERSKERIGSMVERQCRLFVQDHQHQATKDQALVLFEDIENMLDNSLEAEEVLIRINKMKREYEIDGKLADSVPRYYAFLAAIGTLKDAFAIARTVVPEGSAVAMSGSADLDAAGTNTSDLVATS